LDPTIGGGGSRRRRPSEARRIARACSRVRRVGATTTTWFEFATTLGTALTLVGGLAAIVLLVTVRLIDS
jgi:hypothetical protein